MPLRSSLYRMGNVNVTVFSGNKGDILPMHKHNESDIHFTIVARGSVKIHGPTIGEKVFRAGAMIDFLPGVEHEFIIDEDDSRFYNILKNVS